MTKEQIMEREPIFRGLVELYTQAFAGECKVLTEFFVLGKYAIRTSHGVGMEFDNADALIEHMTEAISKYLTGKEVYRWR